MNVETYGVSNGLDGLKVLVVDDSEDNAEMLAELLRTYGYHVRVSNLGRDALEMIEQEPPDAVLVDVCLPDIDGYEVAASVRHRFGSRMRLVALTGFSGREAQEQARLAGFDAFFVKPFRVEDIESALRGNAA